MSGQIVVRDGSGAAIVLRETLSGAPTITLGAPSSQVVLVNQSGVPGPRGEVGPPGPDGGAASISSDADNRITSGTDGGLFVPEILADPLAYYILAKA